MVFCCEAAPIGCAAQVQRHARQRQLELAAEASADVLLVRRPEAKLGNESAKYIKKLRRFPETVEMSPLHRSFLGGIAPHEQRKGDLSGVPLEAAEASAWPVATSGDDPGHYPADLGRLLQAVAQEHDPDAETVVPSLLPRGIVMRHACCSPHRWAKGCSSTPKSR